MTENKNAAEDFITHRMPAPIAVAFAEYLHESSVFKKLHRLVDVYETIMKYATVLAIQNFYAAQLDTVFPEGDDLIRRQIDRPSLGSWARFLQYILKCFATRGSDVFCRELYLFQYTDFAHDPKQQAYLKPEGAAGRLLQLRNEIAHGATLSDETAEYRLALHEPDLAILLEKAAFLADSALLYVHAVADTGELQVQPLMGRNYQEAGLTTLMPQPRSEDLADHVIVYNPATGTLLDLHPLLLYTECEEEVPQWDQQQQLRGTTPCHQRKVLFYNDLKDNRRITFLDYQQGHHSRFRSSEQSLLPQTFRQRFPKPERQPHSADWFDAFIHDRTAHFVGRERELAEIERSIAEGAKAILIVGEPGVGKSTLLAKWASNQDTVRHFIREGDASTYQPIGVFGNLMRQVCERFNVEALSSLQPDPLAYRRAFDDVLQAATRTTTASIVIVIDGIDEAIRSVLPSAERDSAVSLVEYLPDPLQLPQGVCFLLSTRPDVLAHSAVAAKFGRDTAKHLTLDKLTEIEVRALLYQVRSKYDVLAAPDYVDAVVKQSEGNPLYLKMLVEDLAERRLVFGQIDVLPTGIIDYFKRILNKIEDDDRARQLTSSKAQHRARTALLEKLIADNLLTRAQAEAFLTNEQKKEAEPEDLSGIEMLVLYCLAKEPLTLSQVSVVLHADPIDVQRTFDRIRMVLVDEGANRFAIFHSGFRDYVLHLDIHSGTGLQRYAETITRVQARLISYCAGWHEHRSPYALRRYAEHLREAAQLDTLYTLARDDRFSQVQAETFPDDPDLSLQTVQIALMSAAAEDHAARIAEFLWLHSRRLEHLKRESPLDALRAGEVQRSLELADLYDAEQCVLWHLLIAGELREQQKIDDAHATVARLLERELPKLSEETAERAIPLLLWMPDLFAEEFLTLQRWLFTDHRRHHLCVQLSTDGQFLSALKVVPDLTTWTGQAQALTDITKTAARVVQSDALHSVLEAALALAQEISDPSAYIQALTALATIQAQSRDTTSTISTLMAALSTVDKVETGLRQEEALKAVLAAQTHIEDQQIRQNLLSSAREIVRQLTPIPARVKALTAVAEAFAQAGNVLVALDILALAIDQEQTSEKDRDLAYAIIDVAAAQERYGDQAAAQRSRITALEIVRDIRDEWDRSYTLRRILAFCSHATQLALAHEIALSLSFVIFQSEALSAVATTFALVGDLATALATAQTITDAKYRTRALSIIAEQQIEAGAREGARSTFVLAREAARQFQYKPLIPASLGAKTDTPQDQEQKNADETVRRQSELLAEVATAQAKVGECADAKDTAQYITDKTKRTELLTQIAELQIQKNEHEAARATLQTALEVALSQEIVTLSGSPPIHIRVTYELERAPILAKIAVAHARLGDGLAARETALRVNVEKDRNNAFKGIAMAQIQTSALADARETALMIKGEDGQYEVLREIINAQALAGDFTSALQTARAISGRGYRTAVMQMLITMREQAADATALLEAKEIAIELAEMVKQGQALPPVLPATIKPQRAEHRWDESAARRRSEKPRAARIGVAATNDTKLIVKDDWLQAELQREITFAKVYTQARLGDFISAVDTTLGIADWESRLEALKILAVSLARAGEIEAAEFISQEFLLGVFREAAHTQIVVWQASLEASGTTLAYKEVSPGVTFSSVSSVLTDIKKHLTSTTVVDLVPFTIVRDSTKSYQTWRGLITLAVIQACAGKFTAALDAVEKINEPAYLVLGLKAVLAILTRANQQKATPDKFSSAFDIAWALGNVGYETEWETRDALMAVAVTQAWAGLIAEAQQTAQEIDDPWYEAPALKAVALAQARAGQFVQAITTASRIEDEKYRTQVLEFLANLQTAGTVACEERVAFDAAVEKRWGFLGETNYFAVRKGSEVQALAVIATAQAIAGDQHGARKTLTAAFKSAWNIEKEEERAEALTTVAVAQVQAGLAKEAIQTSASILAAREQHLPIIAEAFTTHGDREQFKQLLVPCAYYAATVPKICGLLARIYPQQADALLQDVINES